MRLRTRLFASDRSCLLLLVPLALLLFSFNLGGRDLWAPDEPDTGEVVREMLLTGNWAAPTDNGEPFLEKPPLYHWLAALFSLPAGRPSEFTLRLPSSLAAVGGVLILFFLGRSLFGRRTAALAAIVLATTFDYFMEARWAHVDMLWTMWLLAAALAFREARQLEGDRRWLAAFYLAMGMAVLTKGPVGILLPVLAVVVVLASTRDLAFLKRMGWSWGLPLAVLPAALWLVAWDASGSAYPLRAMLLRLGTRFTSGVHHTEPFWQIFVNVAVEFMPWTLLLPAAVRQTLPRRGARPDRENAYVYCWIVVIFALFAFSAEKRAVYVLPMVPFLALLVGRLWDLALMEWDPPPADRAVTWFLGIGLLLVMGGAVAAVRRLESAAPDLAGPAALLAGTATAALLLPLLTLRRRGGGTALGVLAGGLVACYLIVAGVVLPAVDPYKSARQFSRRVAELAQDAPLAMYPDFRPAFVYYSGRFMRVLRNSEELAAWFEQASPVYCLIEDARLEDERRALRVPLHVHARDRIGHRAMALVSNVPPPGATLP